MAKYKYYQEVEVSEHCLRAAEIAGLFGFFTDKKEPHKTFASALLKEAPIYYYQSSKGLLKGYRFRDYYPIMQKIYLEHYVADESYVPRETIIQVGKTKYKVFLVNLSRNAFSQEHLMKTYLNNIYREAHID